MRTSLVVVSLLIACKGDSKPTPAPTASPSAASLATTDAATSPPLKRGEMRASATKPAEDAYGIAVGAGANLASLEKLALAKAGISVKRVSLNEAVPDPEQFAFATRDLSTTEAAALLDTPGVLLILGTGDDAMKLARDMAALARDVADAAHGWVLDPHTMMVLSAKNFHDLVASEHLDARKVLVVHNVVGDNKLPFLDTVGLVRYGLPDLFIAETSASHSNQATTLMQGAAQVLLDGGDVNERGEIAVDFAKLGWNVETIDKGTGKAVWKTRWADGPHGERVIELVPPTDNGAEGIAAMVVECFGAESDEVIHAHDDPELLAAGVRARGELVKLRPRFATGIPANEHLAVKAAFVALDGTIEWMWVEIVKFQGTTLEGTLDNEPDVITTLRYGMKVTVKLEDVSDYYFEKPNGERTGGYSVEILTKRQQR